MLGEVRLLLEQLDRLLLHKARAAGFESAADLHAFADVSCAASTVSRSITQRNVPAVGM